MLWILAALKMTSENAGPTFVKSPVNSLSPFFPVAGQIWSPYLKVVGASITKVAPLSHYFLPLANPKNDLKVLPCTYVWNWEPNSSTHRGRASPPTQQRKKRLPCSLWPARRHYAFPTAQLENQIASLNSKCPWKKKATFSPFIHCTLSLNVHQRGLASRT